jgi:hypothetical protein
MYKEKGMLCQKQAVITSFTTYLHTQGRYESELRKKVKERGKEQTEEIG